jgi:hypothetical protein
MTPREIARLAACAALLLLPAAMAADTFDYTRAITRLATGIEELKATYPQLAEFSAATALRVDPPSIGYGYHTHKPQPTGGWTSGVPHPDADGLWFHIDFHDPESKTELHTQPMVMVPMCIGQQRLTVLILEGKSTNSVKVEIWKLLRAQGAKECTR